MQAHNVETSMKDFQSYPKLHIGYLSNFQAKWFEELFTGL